MADRDRLHAGDLDRRITIERAVITTDALGGEARDWQAASPIWADVDPVSDGERWRAQEVAAHVTHRFRIRWGAGVTPEDRIIYDGRVFEISGVKEIGRRVGQEITASARAD